MTSLALADGRLETLRESATVFVVDDNADFCKSLAMLIRSIGLNAESFTSAQDFLKNIDARRAGCVVLDVRMPGMSGLELQKQLTRQGIQLPIIFVSGFGEISMVTQALRAGALDFLQKPFSPQAMLERVQDAIEHDRKNRRVRAARDEIESRLALLSEREREVMRLLAAGENTKSVASHLDISPKTVDNHRARIFEKLVVDNAAQLAALVMRAEWSSEPAIGAG